MKTVESKNKKLFTLLSLVFLLMLVFGFANQELYNMFCKAIGINLSPNAPNVIVDPSTIDESRHVKIILTTEAMRDVPVAFSVKDYTIDMIVGKTYQTEYTFRNKSIDTLYFRPVHNVYPPEAANKYTMMKCFCFDDMMLLPNETQVQPLSFLFNTDLDSNVHRIVMHYSLVKRTKEQVVTYQE